MVDVEENGSFHKTLRGIQFLDDEFRVYLFSRAILSLVGHFAIMSFYIFKHEQKIDDQSICTLGDIDRKDFLILDSFVPYIPINLYIVPHFKGQSYFNKSL